LSSCLFVFLGGTQFTSRYKLVRSLNRSAADKTCSGSIPPLPWIGMQTICCTAAAGAQGDASLFYQMRQSRIWSKEADDHFLPSSVVVKTSKQKSWFFARKWLTGLHTILGNVKGGQIFDQVWPSQPEGDKTVCGVADVQGGPILSTFWTHFWSILDHFRPF
jgi:hypothetical protein